MFKNIPKTVYFFLAPIFYSFYTFFLLLAPSLLIKLIDYSFKFFNINFHLFSLFLNFFKNIILEILISISLKTFL